MSNTDNLSRLLAEAIATADPELQERIESDPSAYLDLILLTHQAHQESARLLSAAVAAARSAGHSWEDIGTALGMTRQAAQQRFGARGQPDEDATNGERRVLRGLTAFNEMDALARAGKFGWHSVANGILYHTLERSGQQWEHRRVLFFGPERARLEAEGWQQAGSAWFPWVYYTRPTDKPAIMEDVSDAYLLHG